MADLTGKEIGRYHIIERLGEGGMATVYKAYDTRLERDVAVKVIRTGDIPPNMLPNLMRRFEQEARSLAKFDHPNIVSIYDFGEYHDAPYLVMQYLPGGTLKEYAGGRKLPYQEAARITLAIARALDYAHQRGVIHRDVKPANVLITESGEVKLSDFGIARVLETDQATQLTGTGVGIGTPEYMAPEQWEGKVLPQTDIYALGVVFYELLTGRRPYEADAPAAIYKKILVDPLLRPGSFGLYLPDEAEKVLFKALAKDLEERYESMSEFAQALERLIHRKAEAYDATEVIKKAPEAQMPRLITNPPMETREVIAATGLEKTQVVEGEPGMPVGKGGRQKRSYLILAAIAGMVILLLWGGASMKRGGAGEGMPAGLLATNTATYTGTPATTETATHTHTPAATETPQATNTPELGIGSSMISEVDGMEMVYVPAGEFVMGSMDADENALDDEKSQHNIYLDAYWMDKTEVTNAMFAKFVEKTGYETDAVKGDWGEVFIGDSWELTEGADWQHPKGVGSSIDGLDDHPVVQVSWNDAVAYCGWAGRRLSSEAEWEKAARGTDVRIYPWGNDAPSGDLLNYADVNTHFNWSDESEDDGYEFTAPVGSYAAGAGPYGALDMAGNVWEWVNDRYGEEYYEQSSDDNPQGPASGEYRVSRGGSWHNHGRDVRSARRDAASPDHQYNDIGFRCVLSFTPRE